jgi:5-enolpyruvylshikimate-3-phosphate synthase
MRLNSATALVAVLMLTCGHLGMECPDFPLSRRKTHRATVTEVHLTTDHTYSDHRIALQTTILQWLAQFEREAKP